MARLSQIIAAEKGARARTHEQVTTIHHALQKPVLIAGLERRYEPKDEEGERIPAESTRVQLNTEEALRHAAESITALMDVTAVREWGNTRATADIVVDGTVLATSVPVTYLLFLEKQLVDWSTFVAKLPVLDAAEDWSHDEVTGHWKSAPSQTHRTRRVPRNHVRAEATPQHPAQVEVYHEDVAVGTWTTTKYSGALPAPRVKELRERIATLQTAVKFAREEANSAEVEDRRVGETLFAYLLG